MRCLVVISIVVLVLGGVVAASADDLKAPGAGLEITATGPSVTLPPVPTFAFPAVTSGTHDVRELRVHRKALMGTDIKVAGYVTWIYDCVTDNLKPGKTRAQVGKAIDDDPTICERAKFHLGATRDARDEVTLWVVDVPRPPNKLEQRNLPKDELAKWPAVPKLAVGDYVTVTGKLDLLSPHSERNSDGLLMFRALDHATPPASAPNLEPIPALRLVTPPLAKAIAATPMTQAKLDAAKVQFERAGALFGSGHYADAMVIYREAVTASDGNHVGWYGLGLSAFQLRDYKTAVDALQHAVALVPSSPVYETALGATLYESIVADARETQAKRDGKRAADVLVDLPTLNFDRARDRLLVAISLEPRVWRAHYYLGRILRDSDHPHEAAEAFGKAIAANPSHPTPVVALVELYRKWDMTDVAVKVAQQSAAILDPNVDVYFVLGMALADRHADADAIAALSKAIDTRPDHAPSHFQRGLLYAKAKQKGKAKADLEAFLASNDPRYGFERGVAQKMLLDLAARP